jgi:DNA-directed RNA polymerase specialized sigma24 family protein
MMDSDSSALATMVYDTHRSAGQREVIEQFVPARRDALVGRAEQLIGKCHVVDAALSAEDLVQDTLLHYWEACASGGFTSIGTEEALNKIVRHILNQEVLDERTRENARKRGGAGNGQHGARSAMRRADADLDAIDSHTPAPDEQAIAAESIELTLRRLDRHDPSLRAVAVKIAERFTHHEIAEHLKCPLWVVHAKVRSIKRILAFHEADHC